MAAKLSVSDESVAHALVWRNAPAIPAIGFLVTTGLAAGALYGHPVGSTGYLLAAGAVIACWVAVITLRMGFVVDRDGLAVRFLFATTWVPWAEVASIGTAHVRGSETIQIIRTDDTVVNVPPSLLQSLRPMTKPTAHLRLLGCLGQIDLMRGRPD